MLTTVCVINGAAIVLLLFLLAVNGDYYHRETRARCLLPMTYITMASSAAEIIAFALDGMPGRTITVILYFVNSWTYLGNILSSFFWLQLECDCLKTKIPPVGKRLVAAVNLVGIAAILVNCFYPCVFSIVNNVYHREALFWLFVVIGAFNIACGLIVHSFSVRSGGSLMRFPSGLFVIPTILGMVLQSMFYGVSVIWVGISFGIVGIADALKSSLGYIDALTNVYNRYYLDNLGEGFGSKEEIVFTGIMADLNDFKKINDTFGHDVGDEALMRAADIFRRAVKQRGKIIRLGGDEFVLLIDSADEKLASEIMQQISTEAAAVNADDPQGYRLSVAMGSKVFHSTQQNFHDFLKDLDERMYVQKQAYHRLNDADGALSLRLGTLRLSSDILEKEDIGLWAFELDEGQPPRMYADETMSGLMGLTEKLTPEETYDFWYSRVAPDSYDLVTSTAKKMIAGEHAEAHFPWHRPDGHIRIVHCGGMRNATYTKGIRIEGAYQDITETVQFDEELRRRREARELELTHAAFRASALDYLSEHDGDLPSFLEFFAGRLMELIRCDQVIYRDMSGDTFVKNAEQLGKGYQITMETCRDCSYYDMHSPVYADDGLEMPNHHEGLNGIFPKRNCPVKSSLVRLVYLNGAVNGYLTIHYILDFHTFTDYERQTLGEFANLLSLVLSRYVSKMEQTALEHALADRQRQLSSFGDMVNAALWSVEINEADEVIRVSWSDEFRHMLGYEKTEADFPNTLEAFSAGLYPEDRERVMANFRSSIRSRDFEGFVYEQEHRMLRKNGEVCWYHAVGRMQSAREGVREMYGIFYDISADKQLAAQQKQLAEALAEAEDANKAKTEFIFNMSHDIRTPLNAILWFTTMAKNHVDDREKILEYLDKTHQSGKLLLSLINNVLDVSRIEAKQAKADSNAGDVTLCFASIEAPMTELAAASDIRLSFEVRNVTDRYVYCDFARCSRVILNLVSNAIKYNRAGGWVRVTCEQLGSAKDGVGEYCFTFADNGIGMSEEFQQHAFEHFTRENSSTRSGIEGSGLGLYVCKRFVEIMGGTISFTSEQNVGTTFRVLLPMKLQEGAVFTDPYSRKELPAAEAEPNHEQLSLSGKRVLLVEDNELNREIGEEILQDEGIAVETAEDGSVAVELLREKGADYYDFVLMDIQMPVMDGLEATRRIRKMYPDAKLPIIAVSANAFEEDIRKSMDAGMNGHVAKPIIVKNLLNTMRGLLQ